MDIVILIFPRITALDAIGPYEVLSRLPGASVRFVAPQAGAIRTDQGSLGMIADLAIAEVDRADILLVPGGFGVRTLIQDESVVQWVRAIDRTSTWTTSVCTGALLLGAADVLAGRAATTHWAYLDELAG